MKWMRLLVLGLLSCLISPAGAQVTLSQGGHELDANYRIGGDGTNSARSVDPSGSFSGNMYINGQVNRGASFQGHVPYFAANELNLRLPSEQLDNFGRDSVGVANVSAGAPYAAVPYLRPSQTALGLRGIQSGLSMPGTNMPININSGIVPPVVGRLYTNILSEYSLVPTSPVPPPPALNQVNVPTATFPPLPVSIGNEVTAPRPETSVVFGMLRPSESEQLAKELLDRTTETLTPAQKARQALDAMKLSRATLPEAQVAPNRDVFTDMIMQMGKQREKETPGQAQVTPEGAPKPPAEAQAFQKKQTSLLPPEPKEHELVELRNQRVIVHTLAGTGTDLFNKYMAQGDLALRNGKFYDAAKAYQTARDVDRGNPLAAVGEGLAYLAAGEQYTAAHSLMTAMEMFPPLMEVRMDLVNIMGGRTLDERTADLETRAVEGGIDATKIPLVFELTYIYFNTGQVDKAKQWARQLESLAAPHTAIAAFAHYVLTGEKPSAPAR